MRKIRQRETLEIDIVVADLCLCSWTFYQRGLLFMCVEVACDGDWSQWCCNL